jgi:hypothetical protein
MEWKWVGDARHVRYMLVSQVILTVLESTIYTPTRQCSAVRGSGQSRKQGKQREAAAVHEHGCCTPEAHQPAAEEGVRSSDAASGRATQSWLHHRRSRWSTTG